MIRRPPRSTRVRSSAASDVYKRQGINAEYGDKRKNKNKKGFGKAQTAQRVVLKTNFPSFFFFFVCWVSRRIQHNTPTPRSTKTTKHKNNTNKRSFSIKLVREQ
eukprot:TRINITY_DN84_c0_g1_i1.p2 TRINITY_DN84_c0_g1~~TRINITY_DN84_c0_g1_i1.p2  ORF type:complete len:104 (+),score=1.09 TRINITY_DN84_c0_g1_i1:2-313(+)